MAATESPKPSRKLRLRYPATCVSCGIALSKGAEALWDPARKSVTCLACAPDQELRPSALAGASAAAEGQRRAARRVEEARRKYGDHAAVVAEKIASCDVDATWLKGSDGERRLAAFVAREVGDKVIALHDRLIPGTQTNIDHLFVTSAGVWLVDAKAYEGKVVRREIGPFWRRDHEVYVGGRNRTALSTGVERQLDAVIAAVRSDESLKDVPIFGALCFLDSKWGLLDFPFSVGKTWITYPGALRKELRKNGPLSRETMERITRRLELSLPTAYTPRRRE